MGPELDPRWGVLGWRPECRNFFLGNALRCPDFLVSSFFGRVPLGVLLRAGSVGDPPPLSPRGLEQKPDQVGGQQRLGPRSRILYVTEGTLLQQLLDARENRAGPLDWRAVGELLPRALLRRHSPVGGRGSRNCLSAFSCPSHDVPQ